MGEYYRWVNIDKKEYISPYDFDYGSKRVESLWRGNSVLCALRELLYSRWKGDRVAFLGDEFYISESEMNPFLRELYNQGVQSENNGYSADLFIDEYRNVSCLFKDAEKQVREEIMFFLDDVKNNCKNGFVNEYGINLNDPFDGLFLNLGCDYQYTINYTKQVCYSFGKTKVLHLNHTENDYTDPLPILMCYGRSTDAGLWFGDIVGVADDMPDGVRLLSEIYLDW